MHPMQVARLVNSGIRLARNPVVQDAAREVAKQITKETTKQAVIRAGQSVREEITETFKDPSTLTNAGREAVDTLRNKDNLGKKATKFVAGVGGGAVATPIGAWAGGVIGGLIGGPPGAAIGAAVGPWVGSFGGSVATDALIDSTWQD